MPLGPARRGRAAGAPWRVATDPNGLNYAVADIDGDQITLRVSRDENEPARTVLATKGVPVLVDNQEIVVSAVLTEEGKRPWIVIGPPWAPAPAATSWSSPRSPTPG